MRFLGLMGFCSDVDEEQILSDVYAVFVTSKLLTDAVFE